MKKFECQNEIVSIIIPIYNVEIYLARCIESVIHQTYEALEILLIDDGSVDESIKICTAYQRMDGRIKVFQKENGGLSSARNYGIERCRGKYIAFVDADDFISTKYVEKLIGLIHHFNADLSICDFYKGDYWEYPGTYIKEKEEDICYIQSELLNSWHTVYNRIETMAWNKLYKRSLFEIKGRLIRFPEGRLHEDVPITCKLVKRAKRIAITNERLYVYFQRKDSITHTASKKEIHDYLWAQKQRMNFFRENHYTSSYERLFVFRMKYYIKAFCETSINGNQEWVGLQGELRDEFKLCYDELDRISLCKMWEKLLFKSFFYFPCICIYFLYPVFKKMKIWGEFIEMKQPTSNTQKDKEKQNEKV